MEEKWDFAKIWTSEEFLLYSIVGITKVLYFVEMAIQFTEVEWLCAYDFLVCYSGC